MNMNALRYFLEVAKCQSIRRASERLHVAASAISRQISALEHELGCTLLERRSDGVSLTEAGERLKTHGMKIDAQVQLVKSDIDQLRSLHRGTIKIGSVEGVTENFLPKTLTEFSTRFPEVHFEVTVLSRDEVINALDRYECDIGFVYDYIHHHAVEVLSNYQQPLHAFVPPDHALAQGKRVTLAELLAFDHLLPDSSFGINQLVTRTAKKAKARVAPRMISNQLHFLRNYAQLNGAVVFMPVQAVYTEVLQGTLVPVNLDCPAFDNRNLSLAARRSRSLSPAAVSFSKFAQEQFGTWQDLDQSAISAARSRWWDGAAELTCS